MEAAQKTWELENAITLTDPTLDSLYTYDAATHKLLSDQKPWRKDPHYFTSIRISAIALLKMVMHARSGGQYEIMGLMQGYILPHTFIISDAFRLPVEGTETRVNAQDEANEYMVNFLSQAREQGRGENAVGWYHSHPGYGCWLSGIDVGTQMNQQSFNEPWVAVVVDPDRTVSAGKVEVGAFRTVPEKGEGSGGGGGAAGGAEGTAAAGGQVDEGHDAGTDAEGFQSIPLEKIEDFGIYADRYYSLEVSHFKSSLDTKLLEALWNKYWVSTLAASPLFANHEFGTRQIADLAMKTKNAAESMGSRGRGQVMAPGVGGRGMNKQDAQLEKIVRAGRKVALEEESGLMAGEVKEKLFAGLGRTDGVATNGASATGAME